MRALILAAALSCITSPVLAAGSTDYAYDDPELTRFERVFEVAQRACPAARIAHNAELATAGDFLTQVAKRSKFTLDEQILLKNYCIMWIDGRNGRTTR